MILRCRLSIQQSRPFVLPDLFQIIHLSEKEKRLFTKMYLGCCNSFFLELYKQNWLASLLCVGITIHFDDAYKSKMCLAALLLQKCWLWGNSLLLHQQTVNFPGNKTCSPHLTFANFLVLQKLFENYCSETIIIIYLPFNTVWSELAYHFSHSFLMLYQMYILSYNLWITGILKVK